MPPKAKGIANTANNCYSNATIQLLRNAEGFVEAVFGSKNKDHESQLMTILRQCFQYFQSKTKDPSTLIFVDIVKAASVGHALDMKDIIKKRQNDAILFLFNLLDHIKSIDMVIANTYFYFQTVETLSCKNEVCLHVKKNVLTHGLFQLSLFDKQLDSSIELHDHNLVRDKL
jgi:uncharacterized UBP type Zn finger protein